MSIMVGVMTEQNTTNAIPALQLKDALQIDSFLALETPRATKESWGEGLQQVLRGRGISWMEPVRLSRDEESNIPDIAKRLVARIPEGSTVCWNLGGGQKAQQFAIWDIFRSRREDCACYTNPGSGQIEVWKAASDLGREVLPTLVDLSIEEILRVYGCTLKSSKALRALPAVVDLYDFPEFRRFLFSYQLGRPSSLDESTCYSIEEWRRHLEERKQARVDYYRDLFRNNKEQMLRSLNEDFLLKALPNFIAKGEIQALLKLLRKKVPPPETVVTNPELLARIKARLQDFGGTLRGEGEHMRLFSDDHKVDRFARYFELLVQHRVRNWIEEHKYVDMEALANVEVERDGQLVAEYDVLIATRRGTLLALDAKTFDFEGKDADARLLNLEQASGKFARFVPVLPLCGTDLHDDMVPDTLKRLPWKLERRRVKCCGVLEKGEDTVAIPAMEKGAGQVEVKSLESFLKEALVG